MFHISFSPVRRDDRVSYAVAAGFLIINGVPLDLSAIPEGATLPRGAIACDWLASDIERRDGVIHLTLILPHGPLAPQETRFPTPVTVAEDGPITLPPWGDAPPSWAYAVIDGVPMDEAQYHAWEAENGGLGV